MIQIRCILLIAAVTTLAAIVPAQAQQKITYVVVNNLFSTPAYVAAENGYWANQGLDVAVKLTSSGRAVVQAVQAGDAQSATRPCRRPSHPRARAGTCSRASSPITTPPTNRQGWRARHHRPQGPRHRGGKSEIHGRKEDRAPHRLNQRVYLREWFRKNNLDISKSQLVSVPVENMPITIAQGLVDAIAPWEPYQSQAIRELGPNAVVVSRGAEGLVADTIGAVAQEDWIKKNYDFIEKFATGIAEATLFVRKTRKSSPRSPRASSTGSMSRTARRG